MESCNCLLNFINHLWGSKTPITVFFGTGISIASGNMSADDTRRTILNLIFQDSSIQEKYKEDILNAIMSQTGQFEDFLMRIYDDIDNSSLRTQFVEALEAMYITPNPKSSHAFLAGLSEKKLCSCYVTTNYDLHLEYQIGENKIDVFAHEQLKDLKEKRTTNPMYLKIHGSVNRRRKKGGTSIATFLPQVSDCQIKQEIADSLEYVFFEESSPNKILFIGYSFSDVYDIVCWMNENIKKIKKEVYIVSHDDSLCKLFDSSNEYNTYINSLERAPTRAIPEFQTCKVFMGCTDRFINESSNYLSIKLQPKGKISFYQYKDNSSIALKALFSKANNYREYGSYYAILLRHQLLYEVARCCIVTGLSNVKKKEEIVKLSYKYAMNDILKTLEVIQTLNLPGDNTRKKYLKCINKRHLMLLENLSSNGKKATEIFEDIMDNLPKESREHALMRLRTIFDFVYSWYTAKIIYNLDNLGNEYLDELKTAVKLVESFSYLKFKKKNQTAIPATPVYVEYEIMTPENWYELISNILKYNDFEKETTLVEEPFNSQRLFVEELYEVVVEKSEKVEFECIESFTKAGRPEYVASCSLILGYLSGEKHLIEKAKKLFNDLGYIYGDGKSFYSKLCDKAIEYTKK